MKLPEKLSAQEIRVLQEFRRIQQDAMTPEEIRGIRHPAGGGEEPARELTGRGWLTLEDSGGSYRLTEKARRFLEWEPVPGTEGLPD